ncbi:MAG: ISAs1 family transposase [Dehalococcoidia bacterium]|nr:ISAs1 family transposase [Dehalococcoidia bacterium]
MQYSTSTSTPANLSEDSIASVGPITVSPSALFVAFTSVADPRRRQGVRFALSAILALATAAILSNHLTVLAIAEWGASQHSNLLLILGFPDGVTPHQSTLQRLFGKLNPDHLSAALNSYFTPSSFSTRPRGSEGVAIDGKAQRGRLSFEHSGSPVHALSAFLHDHGIVLAQEPIDSEGKADKTEAELTVAPALIKRIDWKGRVFTGDALFCQRNLCQQVVDAGGDYLLMVKDNQRTLHEDIRLLFESASEALPLADRREVTTIDHGHGRHYDTRQLIASTDLVGYSDWPALTQVFRLERSWQQRGEIKQEVQYGITSLPPAVADAARLLALKRGHWQIENSLHYVKDVTLGEDRSLIHVGNGPSVMAMLRDLILSLLHQNGCQKIAQRLRFNSCHPECSVALVAGIGIQNA